MTTKKDQPMEIGEPNTEVVLEQEVSQAPEMQVETGVPPNTETDKPVESADVEEVPADQSDVPKQEQTDTASPEQNPQENDSSTKPILKNQNEDDRKNEGEESSITDSSLETPSPGNEEGIPKEDSAVGDGKETVPKEKDYVSITETETKEKPKRRRASSAKEKPKAEDDVETKSSKKKYESPTIEIKKAADKEDATKSRKKSSKPVREVLSIDDERTVQTDEDKAKSDLIDLLESLRTGKILSGTIQGVERTADEPVAVIYHGVFKVIIPALEMVDAPADYRGMNQRDVHEFLLKKRLGAEIDYIVKGVDPESNVAVASRKEAMRAKRKAYYLGTDRDGNNILYSGICAEARVISVIRAGIFVDLFGLEVYIPLKELSYQRMLDASGSFQPGQRILVKILEIDKADKNNIRATASVKQASENPYEKALRKYTVGNCYVGSVSLVDTNGVFVALDGGIDCLCSYPKRGRPPRGARVTVRVLGINNETNRIWGVITHTAIPR